MSEIIQEPKFVVKWWTTKKARYEKPELRHSVFYNEDDLIKGLKNIHGNYFVFTVGKIYENKEYFDALFLEDRLEKERQEYLKLKQKFEGDGK